MPRLVKGEKEKDIRFDVRVKNNLILTRMEKMGIRSVLELSRQSGIHHMRLHDLIKMATLPLNRDFTWKKVVIRLAHFFKCLPEDLFSEEQQTRVLETNRTSIEISFTEMERRYALMQAKMELPEELFEKKEMVQGLKDAVETLTPREQKVISLRFGLGGGDKTTMEGVGRNLGVSRTRVMQIEKKVFRKLKCRLKAKGVSL